MSTESVNPRSRDIDKKSTLEIIEIINEEDKTVALAVEKALPQISTVIDAAFEHLQRGGRLIYVGAGTSGRLAVQDAAECTVTYGVPFGTVSAIMAGGEKAVFAPSENIEDKYDIGVNEIKIRDVDDKDFIIGISASGNAEFVCGAIDEANKRNAGTAALICNEHGKIADCAKYAMCVPTGAEVISGSTRMKAGTAQKMVMNMISTALMVKSGKVTSNFMTWMTPTNKKLVKRAAFIIANVCEIPEEEAAILLQKNENNIQKAIEDFRGR